MPRTPLSYHDQRYATEVNRRRVKLGSKTVRIGGICKARE
jgi:hypothetical protein